MAQRSSTRTTAEPNPNRRTQLQGAPESGKKAKLLNKRDFPAGSGFLWPSKRATIRSLSPVDVSLAAFFRKRPAVPAKTRHWLGKVSCLHGAGLLARCPVCSFRPYRRYPGADQKANA